ncbi:MAG: hypothetical protein AAFU79_32470 [Myxococcota bacterium]
MPLLHGELGGTLYTGEEWKAKQAAEEAEKKKAAAWSFEKAFGPFFLFLGRFSTVALLVLLAVALIKGCDEKGPHHHPNDGRPHIGSVVYRQPCRVRAWTSLRAKIVGKLRPWKRYDVLAVEGRWVKVRAPHGERFGIGWAGCLNHAPINYFHPKRIKHHPNYRRYGKGVSFPMGCIVREHPHPESLVVGFAEPGVEYRYGTLRHGWINVTARTRDEWISGWAKCRNHVFP